MKRISHPYFVLVQLPLTETIITVSFLVLRKGFDLSKAGCLVYLEAWCVSRPSQYRNRIDHWFQNFVKSRSSIDFLFANFHAHNFLFEEIKTKNFSVIIGPESGKRLNDRRFSQLKSNKEGTQWQSLSLIDANNAKYFKINPEQWNASKPYINFLKLIINKCTLFCKL